MKKLLLLFTIIISLTAQSQTSVYHPFPDANAYWTETMTGIGEQSYYSNYINGDTLIQGIIYHTIYQAGWQHIQLGIDSIAYYNLYSCSIRQDTVQKIVYIRGR